MYREISGACMYISFTIIVWDTLLFVHCVHIQIHIQMYWFTDLQIYRYTYTYAHTYTYTYTYRCTYTYTYTYTYYIYIYIYIFIYINLNIRIHVHGRHIHLCYTVIHVDVHTYSTLNVCKSMALCVCELHAVYPLTTASLQQQCPAKTRDGL